MSQYRLRFRVSNETLEAGVTVGSKILQTVMGFNAIRSGLEVKRSIERQYKIQSTMDQVKNVTDIGAGVAKAVAIFVK